MKHRWKAVIEYRSENGIIDVEHTFEELYELQDLVERGPDWNAIEKCTVTLNRPSNANLELTIEEAAKL